MDNQESANSNENPIVFSSLQGTLKSIASSKLALLCWRQQFAHLYLDEFKTLRVEWFSTHKFSIGDIFLQTDMPSCIKNLLDHGIARMGRELKRYLHRLEQYIDDKFYEIAAICLDCVILAPNGLICDKSTAKNVLASVELNDEISAYKLACAYCFENDIQRLWPLVSQDIDISSADEFSKHPPSLYYWTCYMRSELHLIPGDDGDSAEFRVLSSPRSLEWSAMEYFWNKIDSRQRTFIIPSLLRKYNVARYLLPKLNWTQWQHILQSPEIRAFHILYDLTKSEIHVDEILRTWNFMKDQITEDEFSAILYALPQCEFEGHRKPINQITYYVWSSAPDRLKNVICNSPSVNFIFSLSISWNSNSIICRRDIDLRFQLDLLKNLDITLRETLWQRHWRELIMVAKVSDLDKLMKLCFLDGTSIVEFKCRMANVHDLSYNFTEYIRNGLCDELIEYLRFCSPSEDDVRNKMKQIVDLNVSSIHEFTFNALVKFNDFIFRSFPSEELADEFRRELMKENLESWIKLLDEGYLNEVKNIIECFLPSEPNLLSEVKRSCYTRCLRNLSKCAIDDFSWRKWQQFLKWCAPNEEAIAKFKKTLPIYDLFDLLMEYIIVLKTPIGGYPVCSGTSPLDQNLIYVNNFLLWYFESEEATISFKLHKINNYRQVDILKNILNGDNKTIINTMLDWFFDGDHIRRRIFDETL
ncbi:uncharacterized protein LOC135845018 [Planococcus citri]|uniref:uncharacterized protein LOC135845018 n=1 Tax=Planococcus citri TaxID=170843 RepID=UPI0031F8A8E0